MFQIFCFFSILIFLLLQQCRNFGFYLSWILIWRNGMRNSSAIHSLEGVFGPKWGCIGPFSVDMAHFIWTGWYFCFWFFWSLSILEMLRFCRLWSSWNLNDKLFEVWWNSGFCFHSKQHFLFLSSQISLESWEYLVIFWKNGSGVGGMPSRFLQNLLWKDFLKNGQNEMFYPFYIGKQMKKVANILAFIYLSIFLVLDYWRYVSLSRVLIKLKRNCWNFSFWGV